MRTTASAATEKRRRQWTSRAAISRATAWSARIPPWRRDAYTGYKGIDDLGLYASDVFGFNDVEAAQVRVISFRGRPFTALGAGLLRYRIGGPQAILVCVAIIIAGDLTVAAGLLEPTSSWMLFSMMVGVSAAVFGLLGLYFAIFEQAGGTTAGAWPKAGQHIVLGWMAKEEA